MFVAQRPLMTRPGLCPGPRLGRLRGPNAPRRSLRGRAVRVAVLRQREENSRDAPHNGLRHAKNVNHSIAHRFDSDRGSQS